jgi:hypothetical protein
MAVTPPVKRSIKEGSMQYILIGLYTFLLVVGLGYFVVTRKSLPSTKDLGTIVATNLNSVAKASAS